MAMKSPPGSISPPAECRDQLQIGPRTRVFGDGASGSSFWKIMAALTFLGQKAIYRRRRGARGCPTGRAGSHPRVALGPLQGAAPGLWVPPQAARWSPGAFRRVRILRKFSSNSENIFRSKFSEIQKTAKTGNWH